MSPAPSGVRRRRLSNGFEYASRLALAASFVLLILRWDVPRWVAGALIVLMVAGLVTGVARGLARARRRVR